MYSLEVENLNYSYQKNDDESSLILDNLSFKIEKGEYVTFIGHNGSGKSTLMKLLVGLLEPNSGSIKIMNEVFNVDTMDSLKKRIGIVFQNPDNQFIGATVRDDIAFGLENNLVKQEEMDPIILEYSKKVGMDKYLDKEPSSLSGGQKQRVAIAGALCMKPDILLLDEATAMLDPKGRKEIIELVHLMKKENPNMTIISVTHHMDEAFRSDRIIVLNEGKIILDDTPINVFKNKDLILKIGLDLPFMMKLKHSLIEGGFNVLEFDSESEVINKICR